MLKVLTSFLLVLIPVLPAGTQDDSNALFALIIGVNQSVDEELEPLRYADDDAARYFDLFRSLGARTYLLTRMDENTQRLHPQAAAEAVEPRRKPLLNSLSQLKSDIRRARARSVSTVFYLVYAGHGNVKQGNGYITLEDARLTGKEIAEQIVDQVSADQVHIIVDACYSYYLAYARGPGGSRRPIHGFSQVGHLAELDHVGLLLSTSSARESHEWEALQAGVFSHEVRSGLYGAADVNTDGQVTYREIAAFVENANAAIPNERFRPRVFARPPAESGWLLDLKPGLDRRLEIDSAEHGHYYLEDKRGVRLADFHNGPGQNLAIFRPASAGKLFIRRVSDGMEYVLPSDSEVIELAQLEAGPPRVAGRGAAHESFELLFSLPFDRKTVEDYTFPPRVDLELAGTLESESRWNEIAGWSTIGLGAAALITGSALSISAKVLYDGAGTDESHADISDRNDSISKYNKGALFCYVIAGTTTVAGLLLLLFPDRGPVDWSPAGLGITPEGAVFTLGGRF